jgi:hypothetical protein
MTLEAGDGKSRDSVTVLYIQWTRFVLDRMQSALNYLC